MGKELSCGRPRVYAHPEALLQAVFARLSLDRAGRHPPRPARGRRRRPAEAPVASICRPPGRTCPAAPANATRPLPLGGSLILPTTSHASARQPGAAGAPAHGPARASTPRRARWERMRPATYRPKNPRPRLGGAPTSESARSSQIVARAAAPKLSYATPRSKA